MLRQSIFLGILITLLAACSGGSQTANQNTPADDQSAGDAKDTKSSGGEVCPSELPAPQCPEGCEWDGSKCRKHLGIIMPNSHDAGAPAPKE